MILGIIGNLRKGLVRDVVPRLLQWAHERGIGCVVAEDLHEFLQLGGKTEKSSKEKLAAHCDIVVALGGDGTMLSTARYVGAAGTPILGVNLGGLGFLAEVRTEDLVPRLEDLVTENYRIVERTVLEAKVHGERFYANNDVVIDRGASLRIVRLKTYVQDDYLTTYIADGLIVSTPTGSTAYSLSTGGPILDPTVAALIISPICPHSLEVRPIVIPETKVVRITPLTEGRTVMLSADGQVGCPVGDGETVEIRRADFTTRWIQSKEKSYYDLLRAKLNWGEDLRVS